ncbi:3-deoxy-D-manno-octulosonic acid kinase [Thioalkalivibrio sp. ALJ15]|uniref:3-deoxy-D-manno-octulosonic acid kinase n=1 Tax=Thioalkalivibrio sp. ALJ15 TaxID=748652 RepID=UPI0003696765|nr:3-deoxy-D-manno-octulosonic acid kinase [Thioalkalivibrio sp. ALJ15]
MSNPGILRKCKSDLFEPEALRALGQWTGSSSGRRAAHFLHHEGRDWVLRHYWRGGLIARVATDTYLWTGLDRSRPVREWRLLARLHELGLPVPRPGAARVCRRGPVYRGDLLSERIPDSHPLDEWIGDGKDTPELWDAIGRVIARFHAHGAWHADLNARNILIQDNGQVWLIDWDRGRMNTTRGLKRNLSRLQRSLEKWPETRERGRAGWPHLVRAYRKAQRVQDG